MNITVKKRKDYTSEDILKLKEESEKLGLGHANIEDLIQFDIAIRKQIKNEIENGRK